MFNFYKLLEFLIIMNVIIILWAILTFYSGIIAFYRHMIDFNFVSHICGIESGRSDIRHLKLSKISLWLRIAYFRRCGVKWQWQIYHTFFSWIKMEFNSAHRLALGSTTHYYYYSGIEGYYKSFCKNSTFVNFYRLFI